MPHNLPCLTSSRKCAGEKPLILLASAREMRSLVVSSSESVDSVFMQRGFHLVVGNDAIIKYRIEALSFHYQIPVSTSLSASPISLCQ